MGRYHLLWEADTTRTPVDRKERGTLVKGLLDIVKQDIEKGITKDWGGFLGEAKGYAIVEGTELEIAKMIQQYTPFVSFEVHPVTSLSDWDELVKNLVG